MENKDIIRDAEVNRILSSTRLKLLLDISAAQWGFPGGSVVENPLANAGDARDASSVPGFGRSPGERNDNPL